MKVIVLVYIFSVIGLLLYSYTQVDLGLTLTRHPLLYPIQRIFQHIGYFQRPLATYFYILIIILLFISYLFFIIRAWKDSLSGKLLWFVIIFQSIILLFAYSAFSYDIFNYIFDARIITHYHQNPYLHRALDYPQDPMLGFMHWTQRTFPYGPTWLLLSLPLSFAGFQYFLLTFFLFKGLGVIAYIGSVYCIWMILKKTVIKEKILGTVLFALNPLVIIESLVSAHNDIVSVVFTLWALYCLINKKYIRSFIVFCIGFGIKFLTIFILPAMLYIYFLQKRRKIDWRKMYEISAAFMIIPVILASWRTNFQPWYLLSILPFAALIGKRLYGIIPIFIMTFFSLLEYIPFFWTGNWNPPIPLILTLLTTSGVILSLVVILFLNAKDMVQLS